MNERTANAIYDILIEECDAPSHKDSRYTFVAVETREDCREFRFQGALGFGGKFHVDLSQWRVDCYTEDVNNERRRMMGIANERLKALREALCPKV